MFKLKVHTILVLVFSFLFVTSCKQNAKETIPKTDSKIENFKIVGYLSSSNLDQIDRIDLTALTHLNLAFANPDETGTLIFKGEDQLKSLVKKSHKAGVKVYISVAGGSTSKDLPFRWLHVLQPDKRQDFINQIVDFVVRNDLDGVDVDIEWNLMPTVDSLYTPFVVNLRKGLKTRDKGITSALNVSGLHKGITQEALNAYDFINVMVYDKTGPWRPENPGQHAPYSYAEEALDYWVNERKIPAEKLTLGVPFYGHDFDKVGSISFAKLVEQDRAYANLDQVGEIYYNGIPTMIKKTELALDSYGGIMIWELAQDTEGELSLLRTIKETVNARTHKK